MPRDAVQAGEAIELAPQVDVLHRLFVGGPPAAALPVEQPLADAFLHVLRISVDLDLARALQQLQRANDRGELHAIVGRLRLTAEQLLFFAVHLQNGAPASRPGIPLAGAIGVDAYRPDVNAARAFRHAVRFASASPEPGPSWERVCRAIPGGPGACPRCARSRGRHRPRRKSATSGRPPSPRTHSPRPSGP